MKRMSVPEIRSLSAKRGHHIRAAVQCALRHRASCSCVMDSVLWGSAPLPPRLEPHSPAGGQDGLGMPGVACLPT